MPSPQLKTLSPCKVDEVSALLDKEGDLSQFLEIGSSAGNLSLEEVGSSERSLPGPEEEIGSSVRNLSGPVADATSDTESECSEGEVLLPEEFLLTNIKPYGNSSLLYIEVRLSKLSFKALVDSGAARTFISPELRERILEQGFKIVNTTPTFVVSPLGAQEEINEAFRLPLTIKDKKQTIKVRVLPSLDTPCILGIDALRAFGMQINFEDNSFVFFENPLNNHPFLEEDEFTMAVSFNQVKEGTGLKKLTPEQKVRLEEFLKTIPPSPNRPGTTNLISHHIDVNGHPPIKQRYYPVSPIVQEAIYEEVDKMLKDDVIEESFSDWSSPIVMIKRNGKYRFCLDFRKVNSITKKDAYPLPFMNTILSRLRSARYISTLDLRKAFHNIPLTPESRPITAFTVPGRGLYQFKKMPFGLTGAPSCFQRLIDKIITPDMAPFAFAYLDDIIIATDTFDSHLYWLNKVIDKLLAAGLIINLDKSYFCKPEVKYLGFIVNSEGLQVDNDKIAAILDYPAPKNVTQVKRLVGMLAWYQKFLPNYSTVIGPINNLLKKNVKFEWGQAQQTAFDKVKGLLTSSPTLIRPNFRLPFYLHTDASQIGLGAMLTQIVDGTEHPIAYASRSLSKAERNYATTELECLSAIWALEKFRPYLEGQDITLITDHSSLKWLQNIKNPSEG